MIGFTLREQSGSVSRFVRVQLIGGLGNQLFSYCAGLKLSHRFQCPLQLDTTWTTKGMTDHGIPLKELETSAVWLPDRRSSTMLLRPGTMGGRISVRIERQFWRKISKHQFLYDSLPDPRTAAPTKPQRTYLRGYFQDGQTVDEVISSGLFKPRLSHESMWFRQMSALAKKEGPVGVHVRLGDYRELDHPNVLLSSYYLSALTSIREELGDAPIWIFSDEPLRAAQLFKTDSYSIKLVSGGSGTPAEELLLMSQMRGLVIANSTLSWWAARLAQNPISVTYPLPWSGSKGHFPLVRPTWLAVNAQHGRQPDW